MGKRPRTPHFISGIGDGNVNAKNKQQHVHGAAAAGRVPNDDFFGGGAIPPPNNNKDANNHNNHNINNVKNDNHNVHNKAGSNSNTGGGSGLSNGYIRSRNERLARLEEPLLSTTEHWREVFGSGDPAGVGGIGGKHSTSIDAGHWQASAFAILGMIVVISAIFLHFVSENSSETNTPYHYRRRQRQRRREYKKKKKTDEWSDDEEQLILEKSMQLSSGLPDFAVADGDAQLSNAAPMYPYYYHQPPTIAPRFNAQAYPRRKLDPHTPPPDQRSSGSHKGVYHHSAVPAYKSPSVASTSGGGGVHRRGVSPRNSFSSTHSHPRSENSQQQHHVGAGASGGHHWGQAKIFSQGSYGSSSSGLPSPRGTPLSGRLRVPTTPDAKELFPVVTTTGTSSEHGLQVNIPLQTPPENNELNFQHGSESYRHNYELNAVSLENSSNFPSFASAEVEGGIEMGGTSESDREMELGQLLSVSTLQTHSSGQDQPHHSAGRGTTPQHSSNNPYSFQDSIPHHHLQSLLLSPGNYDETPIIGNARKLVDPNALDDSALNVALMPPLPLNSSHHPSTSTPTSEKVTKTTQIPYIPALEATDPKNSQQHSTSLQATKPEPPPRSILMDELRLVQMETGNSMHWRSEDEDYGTHDISESGHSVGGEDVLEPAKNIENAGVISVGSNNNDHSESGSSISIPSGDPRKNIPHKRADLTVDTDAAGSLQGRIPFQDLQLLEVIGGGGFGQVWRASWNGTPVAVKVLTGSAQNTHVAKAIIEEFKAEINLLKVSNQRQDRCLGIFLLFVCLLAFARVLRKNLLFISKCLSLFFFQGMRHPNICLYMGACVDPPNRAIITELAANGSVWDALRLPLMPPYIPSDGTQRGCWPSHLYTPDQTHGAPPTSGGIQPSFAHSVPIPPKGAWPWELVKKVACGASRGMAYLHGGKPPVLHRDLKSANLLLDESYTTKVCDFGLSRLKAQERSMTGNCGTVQWMAPEVLANMSYNEKADVYSFGIVLWELLSRECPYDGMTAIQCALAVLNRDKRPDIPKWCPPSLHALIKSCVKKEPDQRPSFTQIILALDTMG